MYLQSTLSAKCAVEVLISALIVLLGTRTAVLLSFYSVTPISAVILSAVLVELHRVYITEITTMLIFSAVLIIIVDISNIQCRLWSYKWVFETISSD